MKRNVFLILPVALVFNSCFSGALDFGLTGSGDTSGSTYVSEYSQDDEGDDIALTTFARTITITFSTTGAATVSGDEHGIVSVSGNDVTVDNSAYDEAVRYELSGTATDGFFKLYSANKQAIVLNGLHLTNKNGAAINNQSKKRTFVVLQGSNTLADGASYTGTPDEEDEKAACFSEGQLVFSGDGSLTVNATGKAGITSDDYVRFLGTQKVSVSSTAGHGVRGKDAVVITSGTLGITVSAAGKKGISTDGDVIIDGATTTITVSGGVDSSDSSDLSGSAGIKADGVFTINDGLLTITNSGQGGKGISSDQQGYFNGGTVQVTVTGANYGSSGNGGFGGPGGFGGFGGSSSSSDNSVAAKAIKFDGDLLFADSTVNAVAKNHEAIESKGTVDITAGRVYAQSSDDAINAASHLTISGGLVCAYSTGNDGLDANGDMYIKGGVIYAIGAGGAEVALDANTEGGHKLYVSGGTLFAIGGLENGAQLSQNCYSASSWSKNTWYALSVGDDTWALKTPASGGNGLVVSGAGKPTLKSGVSVSGGTTVFAGMGAIDATCSGGSGVSLSSYSGGNAGGMPGFW
ncbi:MAG: carbohydrate-binding domain-containing protein [Bacteroidales bacterium]|nr:carbohydrate-binding domain-containing protein [Bacteroidales bacterium]